MAYYKWKAAAGKYERETFKKVVKKVLKLKWSQVVSVSRLMERSKQTATCVNVYKHMFVVDLVCMSKRESKEDPNKEPMICQNWDHF